MILTVNMQEQTYDVVVERNSLTKINEYFDLNRKVLIVTDDGVPSEYSETIKSFIPDKVLVIKREDILSILGK